MCLFNIIVKAFGTNSLKSPKCHVIAIVDTHGICFWIELALCPPLKLGPFVSYFLWICGLASCFVLKAVHCIFCHPSTLLDLKAFVCHLQDISSSSISKDFTYMLVKNGTIVLKATSDLRGYSPGQIIKLETEIENRSGKSTSTVVASFIQVQQHTSCAGIVKKKVAHCGAVCGSEATHECVCAHEHEGHAK